MKKLITLLIFISLLQSSVSALGALYARRPWDTGEGRPLWLTHYDVDVTIVDQIAVTHVDHTFRNETHDQLEGVFVFPLPKNAIVTELALWINGERVVGDVMEKDTARAIYESIVRRRVDPALLEYMGENVFKLSVFPIEPVGHQMSERRIEITYAEILPYEDGNVEYHFFMKTANMSAKPVERASITMDLTSQQDILTCISPSHNGGTELGISRINSRKFQILYGNENAHSEKDMRIQYELKNDDYALNHLTYIPDESDPMFYDRSGDDPYFLIWATPPDAITQDQIVPKNIAFVADVSSSMSGERIVQLRSSLKSAVESLNDGDSFNIIPFSTEVSTFKDDLVDASAACRQEAYAFINQLAPMGLTNISKALTTGLQQTWNQDHVHAIVFLTDGVPTWPTNVDGSAIIDTVEKYNALEVPIFTFGIGATIDEIFLKQLAKENDGYYRHIESDDSISSFMGQFMTRISYPLIKDVRIGYDNLDYYDVFPRKIPNMYAGTQLTILGRYRNPDTYNISFTGSQGSKEIVLTQQLDFDADANNHPFVPRMWASAKIDNLLEDISIYGEMPELVNNVKDLGKKYSIITPYTSMLVLEPGATLSVRENKTHKLPDEFGVQAVPNSFTGMTTIKYAIPRLKTPEIVILKVFDAQGKLVKTLVNEATMGGNFSIQWNGTDQNGVTLGSGYYFAVLTVGEVKHLVRMKLIR